MATATYWHAKDMLPDDILTAILVLAEKSSHEKVSFRVHDSGLQRLFWKLAKNCPSRFLEPFVFSDRGPEPYSPVLSDSFSRLQLSGFVGRGNPDYEVLFLRDAADHYFDCEVQDRLSDEDTKELRRVGDSFLELIRVK